MSSPQAAPGAAVSLRAAASRRNGAKSRGPKTAEGKARSAQNALKHGFRAQKHLVLPGEDAAAFQALEAALLADLAPDGALQGVLAQRIVSAAWRLQRAEQIEAELFAREMHGLLGDDDFGLALIRDCNGARAFDTLLRYRGGALAELWRALRTLKALQAERAAQEVREAARTQQPDEPESHGNPDELALQRAAKEPAPAPAATVPAATLRDRAARTKLPDEPERRRNPGDRGRASGRAAPRRGNPKPELAPSLPIALMELEIAALLAETALVPPGRRK
jgi:hypothetical protein